MAASGLSRRVVDVPELADLELLSPLIERLGPIAIVGLQQSGPATSRRSEILEVGAVLVDGGGGSPLAWHTRCQSDF